jgi:hypothetical protein
MPSMTALVTVLVARPAKTVTNPTAPAFAAIAMAIVPLVVAPVRALAGGWIALGDNGLILLRARDVGTSNHPLLGTWTSASLTAGRNVNNPGPLWFDVLAPFVRVGGASVGLAVGVMVANVAAIVVAAWAAHRAGGVRALILVTALSAGLAWTMGSELLFDAWQPHAMILPFWALLVMCWALASGHLVFAPIIVGVASLLVQTHLSFVYVVALVVGASITLLAVHLRQIASQGDDGWTRERSALRRAAVWSVGVAAVAWVQPLIDQATGEGNLGDLVASGGGDTDRIGLGLGARLVASVVALPPWWTRSGFSSIIRATSVVEEPGGRTLAEGDVASTTGAVVGLLAVVVVLAVVIVTGRRRRHRPTTVLGALAAVAVGAALLSMVLIPIGPLGISPHQMRWLWPISAFVLLAPAIALAESPPLRRAVVPVGLALTAVAALANLPTHAAPEGPTADRDAGDTAVALLEQLASYRPGYPVLFDVSTLRFAEPYSGPVLAELTRNRVDVVVADDGMVRQLGEGRRAGGDEDRRLVLLEGRAATSPPPDARRIALVEGLTASERTELEQLGPEVLALARRDGVALNDTGIAASAAGRIPFERTVLSPGADPGGLEPWLPTLVGDGFVALTPDQQAPFARYSELARRFAGGTVGLYELPAISA